MADFRAGLRQALDLPEAASDQIIGHFNQEIEKLAVAWETGDSATVARFWGELGVGPKCECPVPPKE